MKRHLLAVPLLVAMAACLAAPWALLAAEPAAAALQPRAAADPDAAADADDDGRDPRGTRIPPVPDGAPAELLAYVRTISDPSAMPRSRGRRRYHMKKVAAAFVTVADKILGQVAAEDALYPEAVRLKYEGLAVLDEMGDKEAMSAMTAFARTLVDSPRPDIARRARRLTLAADVDALYAARSADGAGELIGAARGLLEADRNDAVAARVAAQLADDLAALPGAEAQAKQAHEAFAGLLAASDDPRIRDRGERLAFALRRLGVLGRPLDIRGSLVDGAAFDPAAVAGKVLLVGFWSTASESCRAEIAAVREAHAKYGAAGFAVVGVCLDEDPEAVRAFVADAELPWPTILDGRDPRTSLADRYGVETLPTMLLVGRDGGVVSLRARGPALAELLSEQFPDVR